MYAHPAVGALLLMLLVLRSEVSFSKPRLQQKPGPRELNLRAKHKQHQQKLADSRMCVHRRSLTRARDPSRLCNNASQTDRHLHLLRQARCNSPKPRLQQNSGFRGRNLRVKHQHHQQKLADSRMCAHRRSLTGARDPSRLCSNASQTDRHLRCRSRKVYAH